MAEATAEERWAPIPGHEGYEASDLGRVRSLDRKITNRNGVTQRRKGMMLRQWKDQDGYWQTRCGTGSPFLVHRLVLSAFVGPCPDGMQGCHNNADRSDARLVNLRWDTPRENSADMIRHGNSPMATKRECLRGHPLFPPNLNPGQLKAGGRACRACAKAAARIYRYRRRGVPAPDMQAESDRMYAQIIAGYPDGNDALRAGVEITPSARAAS